MLGLFGLVGLLIAAVGLYGTTNYIVSQRTREFGVRIAVGADRRRIVALVLRQGLVLAGGGGGVLLGAVIALPLALVLSRSVFGPAGDPSASSPSRPRSSPRSPSSHPYSLREEARGPTR